MQRDGDATITCPNWGQSSDFNCRQERAFANAIRFISSRQSETGHFASEVAFSPSMSGSHEVRSVYIHSYVLQALSGVRAPAPLESELNYIMRRASEHLWALREKSGWWKFYGRDTDEPPDDADDTSVAYAALLSASLPCDRTLVDETNRWLASLNRIRSESGLFKTWADPSWNRESFDLPDVVVNANILFLQTLVGEADRAISDYLERVVRDRTYFLLNLFAVSPYAVPFLISRCNGYGTVHPLARSMGRLARYVLDRQEADGGWGGDLDSALALLTILNAGHGQFEAGHAARCLRARQQDDGGWRSGPLFRDLRPHFYGSRALTTALCLESLSRTGGQ